MWAVAGSGAMPRLDPLVEFVTLVQFSVPTGNDVILLCVAREAPLPALLLSTLLAQTGRMAPAAPRLPWSLDARPSVAARGPDVPAACTDGRDAGVREIARVYLVQWLLAIPAVAAWMMVYMVADFG